MNRPKLVRFFTWLTLALSWGVICGAGIVSAADPEHLHLYLGTYAPAEKPGIYHVDLDLKTGELKNIDNIGNNSNPSFLALHPNKKFLYCCNEGGKSGDSLTAFSIDPSTGTLTQLNRVSAGIGPCHISIDNTGKVAMAANYTAGSICAMPINADGTLGKASTYAKHEGSSVDKARQSGPHAHCIIPSPDNRFALAADLGLDKIMVYKLDPDNGRLMPNLPPFAQVAAGSGPRHMAFSKNGKYAFAINELNSTLTVLSYDAERGTLKELHSVSTLPADYKGNNGTAEVEVHPSGKFVYGSNRGHNSIAVFAFDESTGKLTPAGHQTKDIKTPRSFGIDPTGKFLLVCNQDGDSVKVFSIDQTNGSLTPTEKQISVPKPVCVKFLALP